MIVVLIIAYLIAVVSACAFVHALTRKEEPHP